MVIAPDAANIVKVVLAGVPAQGKYIPMPGFAGLLSDQQVADLANYIRTGWGNPAAADVTAAAVEKLRGR